MEQFQKSFLQFFESEQIVVEIIFDYDFNIPLIGVESQPIYFHLVKIQPSFEPDFFERQKELSLAYLNNKKSLIHVMQDQWIAESELMKSRIASILGLNKKIHARSCFIKRITQIEAREFLMSNHLQGSCNSRYKYGLFYKEELYAVATFSAARKMTNRMNPIVSFEMFRFATKLNYTVVGGLSKLIKYFEREHSPDELMTYVDLDWAVYSGYEGLGFEIKEIKDPISFLVDSNTMKRYPIKKNEDEINDFILVKNAGSLKLIKKYF